jgi:hypothetical protein
MSCGSGLRDSSATFRDGFDCVNELADRLTLRPDAAGGRGLVRA